MKIRIKQPLGINELGRRQNQEDCIYPAANAATIADRLFVLCDGMGGHEHGEVASQLVCDVLAEYLHKHWPSGDVLPDDLLHDTIDEVFHRINALDDGSARQMGTTLTLLALHRGGATMAHIGDSRIYHLRPAEGRILYKSRDHSLAYDLFMAGELTFDEMAHYEKKNIITRAIMPGMERQPRPDIIHTTDIQPGDYFFLCSDGMLEQMTDEQLLMLLATNKDNDEKRQQLTKETANNADNHSAWLIQIEEVAREHGDDALPSNEHEARCNAMLYEQPAVEAAPKRMSLWKRIIGRFK